MIDIIKAEKAFKEYLSNYDINDDKINNLYLEMWIFTQGIATM